MKNIRLRNVNNIIIAQININSIRNKFDLLSHYVCGNIDIFIITETKLDNSFPSGQFLLHGYSEPFRFDRNQFGGGLLVREDKPCSILNIKQLTIEALFIEINLKKKWLLCCSCNPHKNLIVAHLREIQVALDVLSSKYENIIIIGDFNSEPKESAMIDFCQPCKMEHLINNFTCYKNPNKPTCIDLMLTNKPRPFKNSSVLETGLSDFHKMTLTVIRAHFVKQTPKVVYYCDYKKFSNELFRNDILQAQTLTETNENVQTNIVNIFNEHASLKKRYVRANHAAFMNKKLSKEIMTRSRLRSKFLKTKTDANRKAYNKQRNYCVSLFRKQKKSFFNNLDTKKIVDNKRFWRTVKPFFSDKNRVKNKITLIEEKTNIVSNNNLIAETFNNFFANIVLSLGLQCKDELLASVEHI